MLSGSVSERCLSAAARLGLLSLLLVGAAAPSAEEARPPALPAGLVSRQLAEMGIPVSSGAAAGFVADSACVSCHSKIASSYREKGMARAFRKPRPESDIEDLTAPPFRHAASGQSFQMIRSGGRLAFRRWQTDAAGAEINVFETPVDWILGSGDHARTYLYQTPADEIFQLPLAWYSQTRSWGMAPGFDRADHDGVLRRVRRECIFCHTAYPDVPAGADAYGAPQVFPAQLPEGIGCQRCHGPGAEHVWLAMGGVGVREEIRASIFNPGRLPPGRRDEVCMSCHLQPSVALPGLRRFGRGDFSFRPGEPPADYLVQVDVDEAGRVPADRFEINHHPYRLRQSLCFTASGGALSCLTCHDPHARVPAEEREARFRAACLTCHRQDSCSRPHAAESGPGDCVSCHMPKRRTQDVVHVVMTDHLIRRRPGGPELLAPLTESEPALTGVRLLDSHGPSGALGEVYRAATVVRAVRSPEAVAHLEKTLAVAKPPEIEPWLDLAQGQLGLRRFAEAESTLAATLQKHPGNPLALEWLALARAGQGKIDEAIHLLQSILSSPTAERAEAEFNLGRLLAARGRLAEAEGPLQRALEARPNLVAAWFHLGEVRAALGRPKEAAACYRRALELDPRWTGAYLSLGKLLLAQGDRNEALRRLRHGARYAARPDLVTAALREAEGAPRSLP
jgi:tetratricopeptide (TPR) repeat protein